MTAAVVDYPALVARCRAMVHTDTGPGHVVAVVTRGDAGLVAVTERDVVQFPADETGRWMGYHPADGAHALQLLLDTHARGATHLLVPATSSWWLDHYAEFAGWLHDHARIVAEVEGTATLFELPAPNPSRSLDTRADSDTEPGADRPPGSSQVRFADQVEHLLAVIVASQRPGAGTAGVHVVSFHTDDDGPTAPSPTTHIVVPAELERVAPDRARVAHRRGERHRVLLRRAGLGTVYLVTDLPNALTRRHRP